MSFDPLRGFSAAAAQAKRKKMTPAKRATNDAAVMRKVAVVAKTTKRAAPVAPRAARRIVRTAPPVDPLDAVLAQADRTRAKAKAAPKVQTGGLNDLQRLLGAEGGGGQTGLGGFFSNLGGDVVNTITAIPSGAQLAAENVAAAGVSPLAGLSHVGVPKLDFAENYLRRVKGLDVKTAKAIAADYRYRYGDSWNVSGLDLLLNRHNARSRFRKTLGKAYEHPGLAAMDIATVASLGGGGTAAGARGLARILPEGSKAAQVAAAIGERSILPKGVSAEGGRVSTGARYRAPLVRQVDLGPNTARKATGAATARVEIPRRPYSSNPFTRGIQKRVVEPAERAVQKAIDTRAAGHPGGLVAKAGSDVRFKRAAARQARDLRLTEEMNRARALRMRGETFVKAARELDKEGAAPLKVGGKAKWTSEQVDAALFLHAQDMLDVPGKTVAQARNDVVKFMQEGNAKARAAGLKDEFSLNTIRAIEQVPEDLLHLTNGAPKTLKAAVAEYRSLSQEATQTRRAAGTITPETAVQVPKRFAQMVHEGVRYDPKTDTWTSPRNPYSTVGKNAVYVKHEAVDIQKAGQAGQPASAFARMTNPRDKPSHGFYASTGNISLSRGLPLKAMEKALTDLRHPEFVKEFYDTFGFHNQTADGRLRLTTGKRARLAMEADPKNVTLISAKSLDDAIKASRNLKDGELPDMAKLTTYEGNDGLTQIAALSKEQRKQLVAVPKAAIDALRSGWTGTKPLSFYDTPLQLWRKGILAFAPRWYMNNAFGNTLQYGLLTGGDLKAIGQARRSALGNVVPERVGASTVVADTMRGVVKPTTSKTLRRFERGAQIGMDFNNKVESLIHRAAYISRGKKLLAKEGVSIRKMTPDQLEVALHKMPIELKRQALRDTELFLGDYLRLQPMERAWLRRIFPFYSWMRVIGKLMGSMPFRTPKRTAVTGLISRAANEQMNPYDLAQRVLANRGMLHFGPFAQRTSGINPFFTNAAIIKAISNRDPAELATALTSNLTPIGLKQLAQYISGKGGTGAPISAPPGYNGSYQVYGGPLMRDDPTTGVPDYYQPSVPAWEQALQMIPVVPQLARSVSAGDRQPYDVTSTVDLLKYRLGGGGDPGQLFLPKKDRAISPIPYVSPLLGYAGVNLQRYDPAQQLKDLRLAAERRRKAQAATAARKRKVR